MTLFKPSELSDLISDAQGNTEGYDFWRILCVLPGLTEDEREELAAEIDRMRRSKAA